MPRLSVRTVLRARFRREDQPPSVDAAVLLVHGMGSQRTRETLFEWADPILRRLQYRLSPSAENVSDDSRPAMEMLGYAASDSGEASLIAQINRGAGLDPFRIMMRESRWSESFLPLSRREVFNWAARFLWKALWRTLTYISGVIGTRLTRTDGTAWSFRFVVLSIVALVWFAVVPVVWAATFAVGVVLTLLLAFSSVLLVIPALRDAAASVVLSLVEAIGDPAVLVSRPARAGAMRHHVNDSLNSLRADAGTSAPITVVAHSQGAAIATEVLFAAGGATNADGPAILAFHRHADAELNAEPSPAAIETLITVGAGVSLLGSGYGNGGPLRGAPIAAWRRSGRAKRWINLWATWDPISAGAIVDPGQSRAAATRDARVGMIPTSEPGELTIEERQVRNTANPATDHQNYSTNIPEVIDRIVDALIDSSSKPPRLVDPDPIASRLRWTRLVRIHGLNRFVIASTGLAVAFTSAVSENTFVKRVGDFMVKYVFGVTEELETTQLAWLAPWATNLIVLLIVTVALLWASTRLRAAVERRKVWGIENGLSGFLAAMHLPFTALIGLASAATAALAFRPLVVDVTIIGTSIPAAIGIGAGVAIVWACAVALAFDVPRLRPRDDSA